MITITKREEKVFIVKNDLYMYIASINVYLHLMFFLYFFISISYSKTGTLTNKIIISSSVYILGLFLVLFLIIFNYKQIIIISKDKIILNKILCKYRYTKYEVEISEIKIIEEKNGRMGIFYNILLSLKNGEKINLITDKNKEIIEKIIKECTKFINN